MELLLVGTSHRVASVGARERAVARFGDAAAWLARAARRRDVLAEALALATCHRLECYVATDDPIAAAVLAGDLGGPSNAAGAEASGLYALGGFDAAVHLSRVAAGLDSLIIGEAEIAGQVRRAAARSREAGTLGPYLEAIVAGALRASGRARAETGIARGVTSAAAAAVTVATETLGSLVDRTVVVLGAGEAGRLALARVARKPHGRLVVASRSERHATDAAATCGAEVWRLAEVAGRLAEADVVIAAVQTPDRLIGADHCRRAIRVRAGRPLVIVDVSVPRAVDPAAAGIEGVLLSAIDDLGDVVRRSVARRASEVPRVEAIVRFEARRAYARFDARRRRAG